MLSHTGLCSMPSSARLIGVSLYQFSFTTNAEKLLVFQVMHFMQFMGLKTSFCGRKKVVKNKRVVDILG